MESLIDAIAENNATLGFDATGGGNEGKLAGQILSAMETAANRNMKEYSRYGSDTYKQVYIYGGLDPTPTVLNRSYGLNWGLGGWLLTPFIAKAGNEIFQKMRQRVADEITTTFASNYTKGDVKKAEYCLKDSYLLHKWNKIQKNLQTVDWEEDLTEKKYTDVDTLGAAACAGGACEIDF